MLNFLAATENQKIKSEQPNNLFAISVVENESRAVLSDIGEIVFPRAN